MQPVNFLRISPATPPFFHSLYILPRLDVQIDETASLKTGTVVPDIDITNIGTATNQGWKFMSCRHSQELCQ